MVRLLMTALLLTVGCKHQSSTTSHDDSGPTTRRSLPDDPMQSDVMQLERLARQIREARDPAEEATALKRLQAWQAEHETLFHVAAVRSDNAKKVTEALSTSEAPLRTTVTIYRGQQVLYTFTFVPHDNRNLALIGK